jgi:hypothetical protein
LAGERRALTTPVSAPAAKATAIHIHVLATTEHRMLMDAPQPPELTAGRCACANQPATPPEGNLMPAERWTGAL